MKRSPMPRGSGFKRTVQFAPTGRQWQGDTLPGPRSAPVRVSDGLARAIVQVPKSNPVRSESYRRWIATLACMACGIDGYSQAAHPNQGRGLGQKASDLDVFALCCARPGHMGCHVMHDTLIDMTLEQRRAAELVYIERTHAMARAAGRKEFA